MLDTSIIIQVFTKNNNVAEVLEQLEEIFIPTIVLGELWYGAFKSGNASKHSIQIESFVHQCIIVPIDMQTAGFYGNIKAELASKGKLIPENDIWIGACALQFNIPLFTNDRHFESITGIKLFS